MQLNYLDFDYSEDAHGGASWDAMAYVAPERLSALGQEVAQLLNWARAQFPSGPGPLDEGHDWDYALQAHAADGTHLACHDHGDKGLALAPTGQPVQLTLSLCGTPAFAQALTDYLQD